MIKMKSIQFHYYYYYLYFIIFIIFNIIIIIVIKIIMHSRVVSFIPHFILL